MNEQVVSLEVAKLLREKGFNEFCTFFYADKDLHLMQLSAANSFMDETGLTGYSAPTQSIAAKWLREAKELHISIIRNACGYGYDICKADNGTHIADGIFDGPNDGGQWDIYEQAFEAGIKKALNLI